jgi:hypothetical protein
MTKLTLATSLLLSTLVAANPVSAQESNLTSFVGAMIEKAVQTTSLEIQKSISETVAGAVAEFNGFVSADANLTNLDQAVAESSEQH